MNKCLPRSVFDKTVLLGLCMLILLKQDYQSEMVIFVLMTIVLSVAVQVVKDLKISILGILILLFAATKWPEYAYFVPILFYDGMMNCGKKMMIVTSGLIFIFLLWRNDYSYSLKLNILMLCGLAGYLAFLAFKDHLLREDYRLLEKEKNEKNFTLEAQNSELIKQQEIKVNLERSNERNRIARDIHDTVGHLLSSALLQTGVNHEEKLTRPLNQLQETITQGMNSIRDSVHDLHDESLSLSLACQNIIQNFTFCEVKISGTFSEYISKEYKLACIMLIKESLANVMKHSNADKVTIRFQTHPGFHKLTIEDNGTQNIDKKPNEIGIGLIGMQERMEKLGGRLSCRRKEVGFSVLAILPK